MAATTKTKTKNHGEVGTKDWREEGFRGMFASRSFDGRLRELRHYTNDTPVSFHGESAPFSCVSPSPMPILSRSLVFPSPSSLPVLARHRPNRREEREKYRQVIVDPAQAGCALGFLLFVARIDRSRSFGGKNRSVLMIGGCTPADAGFDWFLRSIRRASGMRSRFQRELRALSDC